jgi:hypothetical protein
MIFIISTTIQNKPFHTKNSSACTVPILRYLNILTQPYVNLHIIHKINWFKRNSIICQPSFFPPIRRYSCRQLIKSCSSFIYHFKVSDIVFKRVETSFVIWNYYLLSPRISEIALLSIYNPFTFRSYVVSNVLFRWP